MSKFSREQIIDKIKACLRKKHGGSPEEIAAAMNAAQLLAEKYGIELDSIDASLDADKHTSRVGHSEVHSWTRVPKEFHFAQNVIKRHFDVDFLVSNRVSADRTRYIYTLNAIGNDIERLLAGHLVIYLARQMNRAFRKIRARNRNAFFLGFSLGVDEAVAKLRPPRPDAQGLIQSRRDYLDKTWPRNKPGGKTDCGNARKSQNQGWIAGQNTSVNRPIDGAEDSRRQLTGQQRLQLGASNQ